MYETEMEIVKRAFDSNSFDGVNSSTEAGYVNPDYWDKRMVEHVRANLVMLQFGDDKSALLVDGDVLKITLDEEPTSAAAVAETASVSISAWAPTQTTITPTEYGKAYQTSDKEMRRAFLSLMENFVQKIGYACARDIDDTIVSTLQSNAGNGVVANGVASSAIASSDTIDHTDIINAMKENAVDKYSSPTALIVNPYQMTDLMKDSSFLSADKFGEQASVFTGFLGKVMGIPVYMTTQIPVSSNKGKAILLSDPKPYAYVFKAGPGPVVRTDYHAVERRTDIVGVVDFGMAVTKANAICTIESYCA